VGRFILDENVSPSVPAALRAAGHDAAHVNELGLRGAPDAVIMLRAAEQGATVITHDTDFVANLRSLGAGRPSVIRVVQAGPEGVVGSDALAARLRSVLPALHARLARGAAVDLTRSVVAVADLPLPAVATLLRRVHDRRPAPDGRSPARPR
jgi:predicted nuclease of predicted toxin-antitoxin system